MPKKIVLFVHRKEYIERKTQPREHDRIIRMATGSGACDYKLISSIENWLSDEDARALKLVQNFANSHNLKLVIHDKASFRARLKKVTKTPTVILGKKRFTGSITEEMLLKAL